MRPKGITGPIVGLCCMACGGLLLHYRIHPPQQEAFYWVATGFTLFNTVILPWMFLFRRAVPWAYLINATSVVVGVGTMTWYSIEHWNLPVTFMNVLLQSTLADSLILLAKLPLAHTILMAWRNMDKQSQEAGD